MWIYSYSSFISCSLRDCDHRAKLEFIHTENYRLGWGE